MGKISVIVIYFENWLIINSKLQQLIIIIAAVIVVIIGFNCLKLIIEKQKHIFNSFITIVQITKTIIVVVVIVNFGLFV